MANTKELMAELKQEAASTRRMLERVPNDKLDWRIHEKSMKLGRLAMHVAEINHWVGRVLDADEFDFLKANFNRDIPESSDSILEEFDEQFEKAIRSLQNADETTLDKIWTVRRGEQVFYQLPKKVALRNFAYNHLYHHRGQLSVYLRLLDVPVPGMYGPSADEKM
jgi:uncharacterized damage-inducible protein DinB